MQRSFKDVVTEVLHANEIVDVLQGAVQLQSAGGGRFKGLCPFHQEKTPSFYVNQEWQSYKCFGCDKHGDAISFLREHEGLTFHEALRKLADRGGVRLPENYADGYGDDGTRAKVLEFLTAAESFYRSTLASPLKGHVAKAYLDTRAFKPETIKRFGLGAATSEWNELFTFGKERKQLSFEVMEASGLVKRGDRGSYYDMFRNRLMFPIRDVTGRIVAFGGRELGDGEVKYINSPETMVYKKSRVLYGLYEGRDALRQTKRALLVEGYFDVLRCFEAGFEIAVAPCGTALTPEQAQLLSRYVEEVVVLFDGDAAGIRAAIKAVGILVGAGLGVAVLVLPDGADPDEYIRDHGAETFTAILGEATDFVRFFVRMNADRTGTIEGRSAIAKELFEIIGEMKDELRRDEYLRLLATELNVDAWACRRDFDAYLRDRGARTAIVTANRDDAPAQFQIDNHHRQLIGIVLNDTHVRARLRVSLQGIEMEPGPLSEVLYAVLCDESERTGACHFESGHARQLFADAANSTAPSGVDYGMVVDDWIRKFTRDARKREAQQLQVQIEEAQRVKDMERAFALASKRALLEMEIRRLGAA